MNFCSVTYNSLQHSGCSLFLDNYNMTILLLSTVSSTQPPHAEDHVLYNTIYMWFATQCTVGYNVQKAISLILGQKPSWAHLLVPAAPPGTARHRQVTCTCQIWILPHFDLRTISVASKLKELQIFTYYWQKIFDGTKFYCDDEIV